MKRPFRHLVCGCSATAAIALFSLPIAKAQEAEGDPDASNLTISGELEASAEYNSNVSVTELESATGEADYAGLLDAGLDLNWQPADRVSIGAGYSLSSSRFQEFDDFDLDLHLVYGDASYDFEPVSVGINSYYGDANLGGENFLTLKQNSLYAARLFGDSLYVRGALNVSDKSFDTFAARDADGTGISADAFWYFNQGSSSLVFGFVHDDEDARDDQYSYEGLTLRVRYINDFTLLAQDSRFELSWRTQERDYKGITPSIGETRDDQQNAVEARVEVSLGEHLALIARLEHADYQSNLSSADYDESRAAVGISLSF